MVLRDDMFQSAIVSLLGKLPERFKDNQDPEPWTIVFDPVQPITVSFVDDGYRVTLRGHRFFKGDKGYPGMNVTVAYKILKTDKGFKIVRNQELRISRRTSCPGPANNSVSRNRPSARSCSGSWASAPEGSGAAGIHAGGQMGSRRNSSPSRSLPTTAGW